MTTRITTLLASSRAADKRSLRVLRVPETEITAILAAERRQDLRPEGRAQL